MNKDELHDKLRLRLINDGFVDEILSEFRVKLVHKLTQHEPESIQDREHGSSRSVVASEQQNALLSLIYHFLSTLPLMKQTVSVFLPNLRSRCRVHDTGGSNSQMNAPISIDLCLDILSNHLLDENRCCEKVLPNNIKLGACADAEILQRLVMIGLRQINKMQNKCMLVLKQSVQVQTDDEIITIDHTTKSTTNNYVTQARSSLDHQLACLEGKYAQSFDEEINQQHMRLEERVKQFQEECEKRHIKCFEQKVKYFRETEISKVHADAAFKAQNEIQSMRDDLRCQFEEQLTHIRFELSSERDALQKKEIAHKAKAMEIERKLFEREQRLRLEEERIKLIFEEAGKKLQEARRAKKQVTHDSVNEFEHAKLSIQRSLEDSFKTLESQRNILDSDILKLKTEKDALLRQRQESEEMECNMCDLEKQLGEAKAEIRRLKNIVEKPIVFKENEEKLSHLRQDSQQQTEISLQWLELLKNERQQLKQKCNDLVSTNTTLENEASEANAQSHTLLVNKEAMSKEIEVLNAKWTRSRAECEKFKALLLKSQTAFKALQFSSTHRTYSQEYFQSNIDPTLGYKNKVEEASKVCGDSHSKSVPATYSFISLAKRQEHCTLKNKSSNTSVSQPLILGHSPLTLDVSFNSKSDLLASFAGVDTSTVGCEESASHNKSEGVLINTVNCRLEPGNSKHLHSQTNVQDHIDEQGGFNVRQCPQMIVDISEDDVGSSNHNYSLDFDTYSRSNENRGVVSSHDPAKELTCNPPMQGEKEKESKSSSISDKFIMEHNSSLAANAIDERGDVNVRQCSQKHLKFEDGSEDDFGSTNHNYSLDFATVSKNKETRGEVSSHDPVIRNPPMKGEKEKESKSSSISEKFITEHNSPLVANPVDGWGDINVCSQKHRMIKDGLDDDVGSSNHNYSLNFDTVSKNNETRGEVLIHDPVNELMFNTPMHCGKEKERKSSSISEKFITEHKFPLAANPVAERGDINVCSQKHRMIEDGSEDDVGSTNRNYSLDSNTVSKNNETRGEVSSHDPGNELMCNPLMQGEKEKESKSSTMIEKFITVSKVHKSPLATNEVVEKGDINVRQCTQVHHMIDDVLDDDDVGRSNHNYSLDSNTVSKNNETRGEVSSHDSVKDIVCTPVMNGESYKESKSSIMIEEFITVDTKHHSPLTANDVDKWGDINVRQCPQKHRMIEDISEDGVGSTNHNYSLDFETFSRSNETRGDVSSHDPVKDLMCNPSMQSEEEKESKSSTMIEEIVTADTKHNSLEVVNERADINVRQCSQKYQMIEDASEDEIGDSNHNYSLDFDTVSKSNETRGEVSHDPVKDLVCTPAIKDDNDKASKSSTINEKFINVDTKHNSQMVVNNDASLSKESESMQGTVALLRSSGCSTPVNLFDSESKDGHSDSSVDYEDDFQ